jgi:hypothetical protein
MLWFLCEECLFRFAYDYHFLCSPFLLHFRFSSWVIFFLKYIIQKSCHCWSLMVDTLSLVFPLMFTLILFLWRRKLSLWLLFLCKEFYFSLYIFIRCSLVHWSVLRLIFILFMLVDTDEAFIHDFLNVILFYFSSGKFLNIFFSGTGNWTQGLRDAR